MYGLYETVSNILVHILRALSVHWAVARHCSPHGHWVDGSGRGLGNDVDHTRQDFLRGSIVVGHRARRGRG
jgi:hypothetical protein